MYEKSQTEAITIPDSTMKSHFEPLIERQQDQFIPLPNEREDLE
jgi:hypothetical protein